jgi:hypothetical protein
MQPENEKQPIRSRRAFAGESAVTSTAVGDERIFGWQPRDLPRPAEDQVDEAQPDTAEEEPTNEQIGVLDPRRGGGQPSGPYDHWLYHEGL